MTFDPLSAGNPYCVIFFRNIKIILYTVIVNQLI